MQSDPLRTALRHVPLFLQVFRSRTGQSSPASLQQYGLLPSHLGQIKDSTTQAGYQTEYLSQQELKQSLLFKDNVENRTFRPLWQQ